MLNPFSSSHSRFYLSSGNFHTIAFDFDGIFTDNKVYVDQYGRESVMCDRSDGLGLSLLKKYIRRSQLQISLLIVSTETNPVVMQRAQKLDIPCYQGIDNKLLFLKEYLENSNHKISDHKNGLIFLGNDLNDLEAIHAAQVSFCPSDAHAIVKKASTYVLERPGGHGFIREFVEMTLGDVIHDQMLL